MNKTIQERYKAGEKLSQKEMIEVVRWRIVYGIFIDGFCRDVGHTHLDLNPCGKGGYTRSSCHIGTFNHWWRWVKAEPADRKGKKPPKLGYYDFLVAHLKAKGLNKWTRKNCPEIVFKELDANNWTGHESGAREEQFRLEHIKTTKNVQPGGTGKGKKRGIGGGDKHFGCVAWSKHDKRFYARWTDEHRVYKHLLGSGSDNIKVTYKFITDKWDEVKDTEDFKGVVEPPKSLDNYKDHFVNAYPDDHSLFNWIE